MNKNRQIDNELNEMGPAAKNVGMNIEQTVALTEILGERGIKGAEAGMQIKGIMLTLATGADETNPNIVGMQKAFENLAAKNMSSAEMVKLFGIEKNAAAAFLLESVPKLKQYGINKNSRIDNELNSSRDVDPV